MPYCIFDQINAAWVSRRDFFYFLRDLIYFSNFWATV